MPTPNTVPPVWPLRLVTEFEAADRRARDVAAGLSGDQLNWHPRPESWSIGQVLQHLLLANQVYLPPISRALEHARASPVAEITPGWFSRWFIRTYIESSPVTNPKARQARAPRPITPAAHVDPGILDAFLESNRAARDTIRGAGAFDVNRVRFKNPFFPLVRFTVGTGFEILSKHQHRHMGQIERVRASPGFPA